MKLLRETIRRLILESKPKLVPTEGPSWEGITKAWTVVVDGERIGEIAKIDKMEREGRHYSDGFVRIRGWQAYTKNRIMPNKTFAKRAPLGPFRTKKEALDWLMGQ